VGDGTGKSGGAERVGIQGLADKSIMPVTRSACGTSATRWKEYPWMRSQSLAKSAEEIDRQTNDTMV
jgi:hypothetical protein